MSEEHARPASDDADDGDRRDDHTAHGDSTGGAEATGETGRAAGDSSGDDQTQEAGRVNPDQAEIFESYHDDLAAVERKIAGEIDPGYRAMVVAGAVFVLLLTLVLPHAGHTRGLDILFSDDTAAADRIGLPSRVFQWFVLIFGIGFSSLALLTRRWAFAWVAVAGTAVGSVFGVLSIWHRQTPGIGNYRGAGPSVGLILGAIAMIVLTFHWLKVVWSRTAVQLEAEEQRRIAAAEEEERSRRWLMGEED
ncbi:Rv2732c family membrane protein [Nocardia albiluteola]|uniref:Rv2732c family membrane protein n=1 Tax=Nocardia albiluteola TaxID=2842303 RepID=UPI0027E0682A|nr:hypothetical protein [Nocardia albiluteola]